MSTNYYKHINMFVYISELTLTRAPGYCICISPIFILSGLVAASGKGISGFLVTLVLNLKERKITLIYFKN